MRFRGQNGARRRGSVERAGGKFSGRRLGFRRYAVYAPLGNWKPLLENETSLPTSWSAAIIHVRLFLPLCSGRGCRSSARRCWKCLSRGLSFLFFVVLLFSFPFLFLFRLFPSMRAFFFLFCFRQFLWLFPSFLFLFLCLFSIHLPARPLSPGSWTISSSPKTRVTHERSRNVRAFFSLPRSRQLIRLSNQPPRIGEFPRTRGQREPKLSIETLKRRRCSLEKKKKTKKETFDHDFAIFPPTCVTEFEKFVSHESYANARSWRAAKLANVNESNAEDARNAKSPSRPLAHTLAQTYCESPSFFFYFSIFFF